MPGIETFIGSKLKGPVQRLLKWQAGLECVDADAKKEDFKLWDAALVNWGPKGLEEELGACEIQLALVKVPTEDSMKELGIEDDGGNSTMMAYHTYKCPHLCCKPVFTPEGTRKYNSKWKKGFYYIALKAKVPIYICYIDFSKKRGGFDSIFHPSGDVNKDILEIKSVLKKYKGRFPENGID